MTRAMLIRNAVLAAERRAGAQGGRQVAGSCTDNVPDAGRRPSVHEGSSNGGLAPTCVVLSRLGWNGPTKITMGNRRAPLQVPDEPIIP